MTKDDFLVKEYEMLSLRISSSDSFSGVFVSIYFVLQAAFHTGFALNSKIGGNLNGKNNTGDQAISGQDFANLFSLIGVMTTIWACVMVASYFRRIYHLDNRMLEIQKHFLREDHDRAFTSRMYLSSRSKFIRILLGGTTFLVALTFLLVWLLVLLC